MNEPATQRVWTVAEAKARLSEILRLAESEGPQRIGARKAFIIVPARVWAEKESQRKPLGRWLIENTPRGAELAIPSRRERGRTIPFVNEVDE